MRNFKKSAFLTSSQHCTIFQFVVLLSGVPDKSNPSATTTSKKAGVLGKLTLN